MVRMVQGRPQMLTFKPPVRTSLVVVFDTAHTYPVTAGMGPFNASYIDGFFDYLQNLAPSYQYKTLPYSYYGQVHDLITNSMYVTTADPIQCQSDDEDAGNTCAAYLLSGGVAGATPWVPSGYPNHPQVLIETSPMVHVEFNKLPEGTTFDDSACQVFGSKRTFIATKFCLAQSGPIGIRAGMLSSKRLKIARD